MRLSALRVEIVPWRMSNSDNYKLNIHIEEMGKPSLNSSKIIYGDDLVARFDQVWQAMGETIKVHYAEEMMQ